ncbi:hypothetical protein ACJRO7_023727 [Eucalyptus globulus]|uniref:peptidylprolyl isomerase n=1 Tax=Eucalyptus globulus TaxID=34317 RepID=A0ABD3K326_EUCGL
MAFVQSFRKPTALDSRLLRPAASSNRPPDVAKQLAPPARGASRRLTILISSLSLPLALVCSWMRLSKANARPKPNSMSDGVFEIRAFFDCIYRGITTVSSRESKLLAENRIIPYEFKVGSPPGKERKRGSAAPKPPPAMYSTTEGMKVGGKRTVIVPPEAGYGQKGMAEIPPRATFELNIELLQVEQPEGNQT